MILLPEGDEAKYSNAVIDQNTSKTHHDNKPGILRRLARAMRQVDPEADEFVGPGGANNPLGLGGKTGKTLDDDIVKVSNTYNDQTASERNSKPGILRRRQGRRS